MNIQTTISPYTFKKDFSRLLLLAGIAVLVYWPLSLHVFSLKNDALNYFLPVRWQVSEAIHNGYFPYWSPYFNLGYCLHGDMQSGAWNPFVWLLSLTGPYTLYTLQIETLLYVYLAGTGMYCLLRYFKIHPAVNIMCATAYMLCGFNIDCSQYLNWITGASLLPFLILHYYKALQEKSIRNIIFAGFCLYLLFVAGYPAQFIMQSYLLLFILLWYLIQKRKEGKGQIPWKFILISQAGFVLVFVVLSLPAMVSYYQYLPLSERGSGAAYDLVMSNPLHPVFLFSLVAPLGAFVEPHFIVNDPLERDLYFGIIALLFTIAGLLIKTRDPFRRFCKWAILISLLFSFGEYGGLRIIAYYLFPLMDAFRHPAGAKIFFIFFSCLLAAFTFNDFIAKKIAVKKIKNAFYIVCAAAFVMLIWGIAGMLQEPNNPFTFFKTWNAQMPVGHALKELTSRISFYEILILNILLQVPFLYLFYKKGIVQQRVKYIVTLSIGNSMLMGMLLMPFPVVKKDRATHIEQMLSDNQVKGYPLPDLHSSLASNSLHGMDYFDEIGTLNMYNKKVGRVDYRITPCNLLSQNAFWFNTSFRTEMMQYPLLYKADSALMIKDSALLSSLPLNKRYVFLEDSLLVQQVNAYPTSITNITVQEFIPQQFKFTIQASQPACIVLFQNHYPLWEITVNGKKAILYKANISFMGFEVKSGENQVVIHYKHISLDVMRYISMLGLLIIILYFLYSAVYHISARSSAV